MGLESFVKKQIERTSEIEHYKDKELERFRELPDGLYMMSKSSFDGMRYVLKHKDVLFPFKILSDGRLKNYWTYETLRLLERTERHFVISTIKEIYSSEGVLR